MERSRGQFRVPRSIKMRSSKVILVFHLVFLLALGFHLQEIDKDLNSFQISLARQYSNDLARALGWRSWASKLPLVGRFLTERPVPIMDVQDIPGWVGKCPVVGPLVTVTWRLWLVRSLQHQFADLQQVLGAAGQVDADYHCLPNTFNYVFSLNFAVVAIVSLVNNILHEGHENIWTVDLSKRLLMNCVKLCIKLLVLLLSSAEHVLAGLRNYLERVLGKLSGGTRDDSRGASSAEGKYIYDYDNVYTNFV